MSTSFPIYPAFCFPASPTVNRWVKLTATDVHSLRREPGFDGQNVFFHLNHPIRLVYLTGCVVAVESPFTKYTIITIDDGSKATIDARITHLLPEDGNGGDKSLILKSSALTEDGHKEKAEQSKNKYELADEDDLDKTPHRLKTLTMNTETEHLKVTIGPGIHSVQVKEDMVDIGTVLKIKGTIHVWRETFQITVLRAFVVKNMDDELRVWREYTEFWCNVLVRPWRLDEATVRRLQAAERKDVRLRAEHVKRRKDRQKVRERYRKRVETDVNKRIEHESHGIDGNPLDRIKDYRHS